MHHHVRQLLAPAVIALEMSAARKAKALEVGATRVIDPSECDAIAEIKALTGGYGADTPSSASATRPPPSSPST